MTTKLRIRDAVRELILSLPEPAQAKTLNQYGNIFGCRLKILDCSFSEAQARLIWLKSYVDSNFNITSFLPMSRSSQQLNELLRKRATYFGRRYKPMNPRKRRPFIS